MFRRFLSRFSDLNRFHINNLNIDAYEAKYRIDRFPNFPIVKFTLGSMLIGATTCAVFHKQIKQLITSEGSQVAGNIIVSPEVKQNIIALADEEWFNDLVGKKASQIAKNTVKELINDPEIKKQLSELLISVIKDEENKKEMAETIKDVFATDVVSDQVGKTLRTGAKKAVFG